MRPMKGQAAMLNESAVTADVNSTRVVPLWISADRGVSGTQEIADAFTALLADVFAFHLKTKNFQWHMPKHYLRDYSLMLDQQAAQLLGMIDALADRACRFGGTTLRSIGHVAQLQRIQDNDTDHVSPRDMLLELKADNQQLAAMLRAAQDVCIEHGDVAGARLIENWIEDAEGRIWFFQEVAHPAQSACG